MHPCVLTEVFSAAPSESGGPWLDLRVGFPVWLYFFCAFKPSENLMGNRLYT